MKWSALLLMMVLCFSCNHEKSIENTPNAIEAESPALTANEPGVQPLTQTGMNPKLMKKAKYRFEVEQADKSFAFIEEAISKYPAYLADSKLSMTSGKVEHSLSIRVQCEYFDQLLKELDTQPRFTDYRNVASTDVSKEFVDLESRLKTKQEVQERYKLVLRKNAGTIEEILAAERQIGQIQEEIEATVSRLNFLKDKVSYSTIDVELYQYLTQEASVQEPGLKHKFATAFNAGLNGAVDFLVLITHVWPFLIVGLMATVAYRRTKKKE